MLFRSQKLDEQAFFGEDRTHVPCKLLETSAAKRAIRVLCIFPHDNRNLAGRTVIHPNWDIILRPAAANLAPLRIRLPLTDLAPQKSHPPSPYGDKRMVLSPSRQLKK